MIRPAIENAVTTRDVTSDSTAIGQCVEDLKKDFLGFHSKWINDTVQNVRFFFGNL